MKKITINDILAMKNSKKIVMLTAYDALFAKLFDEFIDVILVGDSLNMSFNGKNETLDIGVDEMIYHAKAVKAGIKKAFVVVDMPFGSTISPRQTLKNAVKIYKQSGCDAVKIEGGKEVASMVKLLTTNSILVVSHIGLRPQMSRFEGGYKIKGKDQKSIEKLMYDAKALEDAGTSMIVLEGIIAEVAKKITDSVKIPTIGIGSGVNCDGQVLVWSDAFGFFDEFKPKFVKHYLDGANLIRNATKEYADEVRKGKFPSNEHEYQR